MEVPSCGGYQFYAISVSLPLMTRAANDSLLPMHSMQFSQLLPRRLGAHVISACEHVKLLEQNVEGPGLEIVIGVKSPCCSLEQTAAASPHTKSLNSALLLLVPES